MARYTISATCQNERIAKTQRDINMQDPDVRHSYVQINNSYVHLVQYGLEDSMLTNLSMSTTSVSTITNDTLNSSSNSDKSSQSKRAGPVNHEERRKLIIFVPGNPGCLGIYHDFLVALFRTLSCSSVRTADGQDQLTILAIGHNNFDHPEEVDYKSEERICIEEKELNFVERATAKKHLGDPNHMELQVLNKLVILKRIIKIETCKIIFIAHSIGGYVVLKLLQDRIISSSHEGSVLIHPALENLALTTKGSSVSRMFDYKLDLLVKSAAFLLQLLPKQAKLAIARWHCPTEFVQNSSQIAVESVAQLVCQRSIDALLQMAKSELAMVRSIDTDLMLKPHVPKLRLIYAINDHWVNADNRRLLSELYPELHIEEQDRMHAFVMEPQTVMDYAVKVGLFVRDLFNARD